MPAQCAIVTQIIVNVRRTISLIECNLIQMKSKVSCDLKCRHLHGMLFMIMLNDLSDRETFFSLFIIMCALHISIHTHTHTHFPAHSIHRAIHFNFNNNCFLILFLALIRNKLSFQWLQNRCSQLKTLNQMPLSIESFSHWAVRVCIWAVSAPCALLLIAYVHQFNSDIRFIENWNSLLLL